MDNYQAKTPYGKPANLTGNHNFEQHQGHACAPALGISEDHIYAGYNRLDMDQSGRVSLNQLPGGKQHALPS